MDTNTFYNSNDTTTLTTEDADTLTTTTTAETPLRVEDPKREKYNKYMQKYMQTRKVNITDRMFALIDMVEDLSTKLDTSTAAILSEVAGRGDLSEKAFAANREFVGSEFRSLEKLIGEKTREDKVFLAKTLLDKAPGDLRPLPHSGVEKPLVTLKFEGKLTKWNLSDAQEILQQLLDAKVAQNSTLLGLRLTEEYNRANIYGKIIMLLQS
jgi:hypothetical protein